MQYGECVKGPKEIFASFKLNIKSIMNKLKQKYSSNSGYEDYVKLDYMNELNELFLDLQIHYEKFLSMFF